MRKGEGARAVRRAAARENERPGVRRPRGPRTPRGVRCSPSSRNAATPGLAARAEKRGARGRPLPPPLRPDRWLCHLVARQRATAASNSARNATAATGSAGTSRHVSACAACATQAPTRCLHLSPRDRTRPPAVAEAAQAVAEPAHVRLRQPPPAGRPAGRSSRNVAGTAVAATCVFKRPSKRENPG